MRIFVAGASGVIGRHLVSQPTVSPTLVVKGRNRDTAWFSITDSDGRRLKGAYDRWLSPDNFDQDGWQRIALSELTAPELPPGPARDTSHVEGPG